SVCSVVNKFVNLRVNKWTCLTEKHPRRVVWNAGRSQCVYMYSGENKYLNLASALTTNRALMAMMTPLPPNETQTNHLLSGTYLSDLKKPETEMRSLMRLNGDELTLELSSFTPDIT